MKEGPQRMAEILALKSDTFETEALKAEGLVLVCFHATWCTHSKRLLTVIREVTDLYADRMKMTSVDVFTEHPVPQQYRIFHTPTVIFFRNGEEVLRMAGSGVREHLKDKIEEILAA